MKIRLKGGTSLIIIALAVLSLCAGLGVREAGESGAFYFVQITDTHFGARGYLEQIEKTVAEINQLPVEIGFVVHTGDIMNDNITAEDVVAQGLAALAELEVPVYFTAGNHDISGWLPEEETTAYTRSFGDLVHYRDYHQVRFVFAFTVPLEIGIEVQGYNPLREIEALLESPPRMPAIVLLHNPPLSDRINPADSLWRREAGERWNELLSRYNVKAVLAGHLHTDELYWQGDTPLYIAPAVYNHGGRPQKARFRVYKYDDGKLSYWTRTLD
jgi:3',5'-cyclic AMP phosphodiesterase CpdA